MDTAIAERISALLEEKNIRPGEFADMLGIFEEKITEWKQGNYNPTLGQIVKISDYLNVSTDYLLRGEASKEIIVKCSVCGKKTRFTLPPVRDKIK